MINTIDIFNAAGKKRSHVLRATLSPLYFAGLMAFGCVSVAQAAVIAGAGQASHPGISVGGNGATIVDINAAGKDGVSHNIFNRFDVDKNGVVLNNSASGINSQLAGNITGNANLTGGTASVILNEVNSNNASILRGMIEVGGDKAQVIIANPAGISCSGCGFINANRATLVTGRPEFSEGVLQGYRVEKGNIVINGDGLISGDTNYTELIARFINVNAEVRANDLKVIVGRNKVSADAENLTELDVISGVPGIGLDVSALGGMYAGKITLVSTEKGAGVRNYGTIGANVSDLVMGVNGVLDNIDGELTAARNANVVTVGSVNNLNGAIRAGSGINIITNNALFNNTRGTLASSGLVNINSGQMNNTNGLVQAGLLTSIDTNGQTLTNTGRVNGTGIFSGYGITLKTGLLNNNGGAIATSGKSTINSGALDNRNGQIYAYGTALSDLNMTVAGAYDNRNGEIAAQRNINLSTYGALNNSSRGKMSAGGNFTLNTNQIKLNNSGGLIEAGNLLDINSGEINNANGILQSAKVLKLDTNGKTLTNSGRANGTGIFSGTSTTLTTARLDNNAGQISSSGDINVNNTGAMYNRDGRIEGEGKAVIHSNSLDNRTGGITLGHDAEVHITNITNNYGVIASKGTTSVYADSLNNNTGVVGGRTLNLDAETLKNDAGLVFAEFAADVKAGTIYNRNSANFASEMGQYIEQPDADGGIISKKDLTITSSRLYNNNGLVASTTGNVMMTADSVDNSFATIAAMKDLALNTGSLNNNSAIISANGVSTITLKSAFTNTGAIQGVEGLNINAQATLDNYGKLLSEKVTSITSQNLYNQRSAVITGKEGVNLNITDNYINIGTVNGTVSKK